MQNKPALQAVTVSHLVVSTLVTAVIAAGDAGFQYFQSNGSSFSLVQLVGAVLVALFATLGTGIISLEKNPTIEQAIDGKLAPYASAFSQQVAQHASVINQGMQLVGFLTELAQKQAVQQSVAPTVARPVAQQAPIAPATTQPAPAPLYAPNVASTATAQVPFPPTSTVSANTYGNLSFGDTGVVPSLTPTHQ